MKTTRILLAVLAVTWIVGALPKPVQADGDPVLRFKARSDVELDLGMIVDDLLPLFLQSKEAANPQWAGEADAMVRLMGLHTLDKARIRSNQSMRGGETQVTITLKPDVTEGFLPALAGVPSGQFRFGRYLDPDQTVAVVSFENFSAGLQRLVEVVADAGIPMGPRGLTRNEDGSVSVSGINLSQELFPYLEGELDLILFPPHEGQGPGTPNVAVVLGTPGGPALREHAFDLLSGVMGPDNVEQMRGTEGEAVGDFTFYPLPKGLMYGVGPNFLIVTTDLEGMKPLLTSRQRGIRAPKGRQYVRIDMDRFLDYVSAAMAANQGASDEDRMMAQIFGELGKEPIGTLEMAVSSRPGRIEMEVHQPGNLWNVEYQLLKQMAAHAGELKAASEERGNYQGMVSELDKAMTAYGKDHDGVFPETPQALVDDGYLDAFPDLTPTPLGQYVDGGYTYVPLRNAEGTITGYYLFVYGGGKNSGFDVFTPENVTDPATFRVASDGKKDGVISFCYDGTALAQVEAWRQGN